MKLKGVRIGFCVTGSFCTFDKVLEQLKRIIDEGRKYNLYFHIPLLLLIPVIPQLLTSDERLNKLPEKR